MRNAPSRASASCAASAPIIGSENAVQRQRITSAAPYSPAATSSSGANASAHTNRTFSPSVSVSAVPVEPRASRQRCAFLSATSCSSGTISMPIAAFHWCSAAAPTTGSPLPLPMSMKVSEPGAPTSPPWRARTASSATARLSKLISPYSSAPACRPPSPQASSPDSSPAASNRAREVSSQSLRT